MKFEDDFNWANSYIKDIASILKENAQHLINVYVATPEDDMLRATDMVIQVNGGDVACRMRRESIWQDWTIRSKRASGVKTELDKLRDGFAKWYLYAWVNSLKQISSWVLIDLDKVRSLNILEMKWRQKINKDGVTGFIIIPIQFLKEKGCIVAEQNID